MCYTGFIFLQRSATVGPSQWMDVGVVDLRFFANVATAREKDRHCRKRGMQAT